jgi:hypothetical protein
VNNAWLESSATISGEPAEMREWWNSFNYPVLTALINKAYEQNLTLRAAEYARRMPVYKPMQEPFYLLHDSCVESCQLISKSLAASPSHPFRTQAISIGLNVLSREPSQSIRRLSLSSPYFLPIRW